jgi:hypothetical protein
LNLVGGEIAVFCLVISGFGGIKASIEMVLSSIGGK